MEFQGVYYNSIDPKGRASIPAKFREQLKELGANEELVVTQDRCGVVAYPVSEWESFLDKFSQLPNDQFREDLYFTTVTPAAHCTFDKQGRIQLPQSLREYCRLDVDGMRDVVIVGGGPAGLMAAETARAAGVEVVVGVEADACERQILGFGRAIRGGLPEVTAKVAISLDGHLATAAGESRWITGPEARADIEQGLRMGALVFDQLYARLYRSRQRRWRR